MSDPLPFGDFNGTDMPLDYLDYEIGHKVEDGYAWVVLTVKLPFGDVEVKFKEEGAEEFITEFRDQLVLAKQERLEWQTDTDPNTGVAKADGGSEE